jgi:hypothetical protein
MHPVSIIIRFHAFVSFAGFVGVTYRFFCVCGVCTLFRFEGVSKELGCASLAHETCVLTERGRLAFDRGCVPGWCVAAHTRICLLTCLFLLRSAELVWGSGRSVRVCWGGVAGRQGLVQ